MDLISRQAAIDAVISLCDDCNTCYCGSCRINDPVDKDAKKVLEELPSAQPEPCDDAVSRKAAIDAALSAFSRGLIASPDIRKLPAVQPERKKGKWIEDHCSECGCYVYHGDVRNFCPNCGSYNGGENDQSK